MNTSQGPSFRPHTDLPVNGVPPLPRQPARNGHAHPLKTRRSAPRPLFATAQQHQLRGFSPNPVEPLPHIDNFTASSEHAFAGRDVRRPSKLPLGVQAMAHGRDQQVQYADWPLPNIDTSGPPSSPLQPPRQSPNTKGLRPSKSVGDGLRRLRHRASGRRSDIPENGVATPESMSPRPAAEGFRSSFRSFVTSNSSQLNTSSANTERSSYATGNSSHSEFLSPQLDGHETDTGEGDMSVEDAIGMYEDGFESGNPSMEIRNRNSLHLEPEDRPSSQPGLQLEVPKKPTVLHRRSQSASLLTQWTRPPEPLSTPKKPRPLRQSADIVAGRLGSIDSRPSTGTAKGEQTIPRDRYGFKKLSHHVSVQEYDVWDAQYTKHLDRRLKKWDALMKSYGLSTENAIRFPPKSDKIKRYVRKGVPPHMRGAAWFWYAGGPGQLAKDPGLYQRLLNQIEKGELTDNDREHIERDLNRTFPDNIRFKPDPSLSELLADARGGKQRKSIEVETPIVKALRRVLQTFAVHNPSIGYCQSLNFIAGLLLLFLDEDEVKVFTLLNIVTSVHLPGTHGVALEGANIDIAVLMSCIKDTLPNIWTRLDDQGGGLSTTSSAQALRLPTVSLATTAWFMSLFVGTLPIESVLRVWDCLFFEGSKTLFRIAVAIFKAGERQILAVTDPMEIFQVVQTIPRSMLDVNGLMEICFRRRGGFGHISQELIERRRVDRRKEVREGIAVVEKGNDKIWKPRWRAKTKTG